MKTAVLISGQLREFARCYPTQRWQVYRRHEPCEFFLVIQRQPDADEILTPLLRDYPGKVHVLQLDDPDLPISPAVSKGWHEAPFANAAPAKNLLLQHWYQEQVWRFYVEKSGWHRDATQHRLVIRQRADNFFHEYEPAPNAGLDRAVYTPWWGTFGGLNDRFALIYPKAAPDYFGVYGKIEAALAAGAPFHPETLLRYSCAGWHCWHVHTIFSTARPKGHPQYPQRWPEILPWEKRPMA